MMMRVDRSQLKNAMNNPIRFLGFGFGIVSVVVVAFTMWQYSEKLLVEMPELGPAEVYSHQLQQHMHQATDRLVTLRLSAGEFSLSKGYYADAVAHCEVAKKMVAPIASEQHVAVLLASGVALNHLGRLQEARRDLEGATAIMDPNGDQAVVVLQSLGNVRRELGHLDAALKLYWQAWEVGLLRERADSEKLPMVAADIGETHARKGELNKAIEYLQQAIEQQEHLGHMLQEPLVAGDPRLASMHSFLAGAYHGLGDTTRAIGIFRKTLHTQKRMLRPGHPELVATLLGLIRALRDNGDSNGALRTAKKTEEAIRTGPHEGLDLSRLLITKADLLRESNQNSEARLAIEEVVLLQNVALDGEESYEVAVALNMHGSILHDHGEHAGALEKYTQALDVNMRTVGFQHPETAATHNFLGALYEDTGDIVSASSQYRKCLEIQMQTVGVESPSIANTYNNLATVLFRQGAAIDAAQLLQRAVQVLDYAGVPANNPDRELYSSNLAAVLRRLTAAGVAAPAESPDWAAPTREGKELMTGRDSL